MAHVIDGFSGFDGEQAFFERHRNDPYHVNDVVTPPEPR